MVAAINFPKISAYIGHQLWRVGKKKKKKSCWPSDVIWRFKGDVLSQTTVVCCGVKFVCVKSSVFVIPLKEKWHWIIISKPTNGI